MRAPLTSRPGHSGALLHQGDLAVVKELKCVVIGFLNGLHGSWIEKLQQNIKEVGEATS